MKRDPMKLRIVITNEETGEVIRDLIAEGTFNDSGEFAQEITDVIDDGDYKGYVLRENGT